jgi:hypothetical protein
VALQNFANYLTEQNIPFVIRNIDDSKCNRSALDYSPFKILKTMPDLEQKHISCITSRACAEQLAFMISLLKHKNKKWILRTGS